MWNEGHGSTGPIADRDGRSTNYADTVSTEVAPLDPTIVFISSYFNDRPKGPAAIAEAFAMAIDRAQSLPTHPLVIVTGTYDPTGINGSPYAEIDGALAPICQQRAVPFIEPRTGNVYSASGQLTTTSGPWVTPANRATVIGPDGRHQSVEGQQYVAHRMFEAIQALS